MKSLMNILHAHYSPALSGLFFWEETAEVAAPIPARGRTSQKPKPKSHPFCRVPALAGEKQTVILRLPAVKGVPLPSPQLIHTWDLNVDSPVLAPFQLEGIFLSPEKALAILLAYSTPNSERTAHVLPSYSLQFWAKVAALTLETLAAHKIVPVIEGNDARWLPVLDLPKDAARLAQLAAAMPAVCSASYNPDVAGDVSPQRLLTHFLNSFCDALTRVWGRSSAPRFYPGDDTPAYHWLKALFNEKASIGLTPNQSQSLASSHRAWMRNLHVAGDAAFRIAFRMEAPALQKDPWQLHYLVQARDDPSLLIPAEEVWKKSGKRLTQLGHRFEQPQEKLLAGLGYAARLFPPLTESLEKQTSYRIVSRYRRSLHLSTRDCSAS